VAHTNMEIKKWDGKRVEDYDTFIFDCDGVLWRGADKIPGASDTVKKLMDMGKNVYFVTNNSTKSRKQYVSKIQKHAIPIKDSTQILSSAFAAASYLKHVRKFEKKALVIGHEGIELELKEHGIESVSAGAMLQNKQWTIPELLKFKVDPDVGVVVVGMDLEFTYSKSALAALHMQKNKGCFLLSTNQDYTFPSEGGMFLPGAGAAVAHVEAACEMKAVNVGKPESFMFNALKTMNPGIDLKRAIMVGDRLNTDMRFGNQGGASTLLVLTGVTSEERLKEPIENEKERPSFVIKSVADLFK